MRMLVLIAAAATAAVSFSAAAAGVDSRAYTCAGLQALIARQGFVFISEATFGDFVVAHRSFCADEQITELRGVLTRDSPECPVNYCVDRGQSGVSGGM